jgi:hypothetical protein
VPIPKSSLPPMPARSSGPSEYPVLRNYAETRYGAKSWKCQRRVVARIEASTLGMDIRYVVTSLTEGSAEHIYDTLYCARGKAENLIKRTRPSSPAIAPRADRPTPTRCA